MKLMELEGRFTVCKLEKNSPIPFEGEYIFAAKTKEELSLVCKEEQTPKDCLEREDGWKALKIEGILDFSLIGVLAKISAVLAENKIGIFVISTFNTDYILMKEENFEKGCTALKNKKYKIEFFS